MNQGLETMLAQVGKRFPLLNSFKGEQPGEQPCSHMTHILDLICMLTKYILKHLYIVMARTSFPLLKFIPGR